MHPRFTRKASGDLMASRRYGLIALAVLLTCGVAVGFDERLDDVMYQDPALPGFETRTEFPDDLAPLWLQALARPESELQRMAADTIALAHRAGMPRLDVAADRLLELLQQDQLEPSVRRAAANALVTLDAKQAAQPFAQIMSTGSLAMVKIVEPALARWDYEPARATWRLRLADPEIERARLQLAIECLGVVKDTDALPTLLRIAKDVNAEVPMRLSAARASAEIDHNDLIAAANELASTEAGQPTASLLAATLLSRQSGAEAVAILKRLAAVESVTASGAALRRLFEIDPSHVYEFAAAAIQSKDVNVRHVGAAALAHRADAEAIAQLTPLLNDTNPGLRRAVSSSLLRLAEQAPLRDVVIQTSTDVVSRDEWRGLEQAVIVLGSLDHEPVAPRLVELLTHARPEVLVAAAWGLRKLAVPETLPPMLAQAEQQVQLVLDDSYEPRYLGSIDAQLSHLFQAFGELGYGEGETLMRKFIPKTYLYGGWTRPAAVWAVGKLNEGKLDEALAKQLAARVADIDSTLPETEPVRRMSAIGIGRMKAESQLDTLRQFAVPSHGIPGLACAWAIERINGEVIRFSLDRVTSTADWFLVPHYAKPSVDTE